MTGAAAYSVEISNDGGFATLVGGRPTITNGTSFSIPLTLPRNTYYWRVTPLDAEGNRGTSAVWKFAWAGPASAGALSATNSVSASDLQPFPGATTAFDFVPRLSWKPAARAVRYEVEINPASNWAIGSRVCCTQTTANTSLTPTASLPSNKYYWRVRPLDASGNAGSWFPNSEQGTDADSFTKTFDNNCSAALADNCIPAGSPTVPDLHLEDAAGDRIAAGGSTNSPVVRWNAVPGASSYQYDIVPYDTKFGGCQWGLQSGAGGHASGVTATTAWTPLASAVSPPFPATNIRVASDTAAVQLTAGWQYCARVRARSDRAAANLEVMGDYTYLPSPNQPAFTFSGYPASGGGVSYPLAVSYRTPADSVGAMPLFTWAPVAGAASYWIIVARDASFTNLVDYALTRIPAYAPRTSTTSQTYADEATKYYWVVIPTNGVHGECSGLCGDPLLFSPAAFSKAVPPTDLTQSGSGLVPIFDWKAVPGARRYEFQASTDPNFGSSVIDDVTTVATSYTATQAYPAGKKIYWRVRAYDENLVGLTWSNRAEFTAVLPGPTGLRSEAGGRLPTLRWNAVAGAASYDVHIETPGGTKEDFTRVPFAAFTPTTLIGVGIFRWQVRANFATGFSSVAGRYSRFATFRHDIWQPAATRTLGSARHVVLAWTPVPFTKSYTIQISTRRDFSQIAESARTDNANYAPTLAYSVGRGGVFFWRVAAADASFNTGQFTSPKTFVVH